MLSGLELTFIGLTWSTSDLFSTPDFIVSPVGKRERRVIKKETGRREKGIEKEWKDGGKEGRRNKKRLVER